MALGVRSYGSTLLTQNLLVADNLPDKIPALKNFSRKILEPSFKCVEDDCGTTVGRLLQIPESTLVGLVELDTNRVITDQHIIDLINLDRYTLRVRDTSSCVSKGGFCRRCGTGYNARVGIPGSPAIDEYVTFKPESSRPYQNYISNTYSGSVMGWLPLAADPLPSVADNWSLITSHSEMDGLCYMLKPLGMARDDYDYLFQVEDILERALLIIGTYGVYGNA